MGLVVEPKVDAKGNFTDQPSRYEPDERTRQRIKDVQKDYQTANNIRNEPFEEFNNRDLIQYLNDSQRAFNSFVPDFSDDPDEAWRANTVRPLTRNKIISIAAHITSKLLFPNVFAQNSDDQEDRDAALVMKDLLEFSLDESDYEKAFTFGIIAAIVNPAMIIHEDFTEVKRTIKEIQEDGSWEEKEVVDEVFSGFQNNIVPIDEFFIGDPYEFEMQKQPFVIWRRVITYTNARIKYGTNENFEEFVRPGLRIFYIDERDSFYEQWDENLEGEMVEEVIYYNRFADLKLTYVNGVAMDDDPDNPLQRKDKMYPFVKTGYELIDEGRFFYYKSLADKLRDDQRVIDTLYNMVIDGTFIQLMPPAVIIGDEEVDTAVIMPGAVTTLSDANSFQTINTNNNLVGGFNAINMVEKSMNESSADPLQSGQALAGAQTAFEIARLEENAQTVLGLFGKMIKFMVEDFGKMRINTITQYMSINSVLEVVGDTDRVRLQSVLVRDRNTKSGKKSRRIDFRMDIPGEGPELEKFEEDMLEEEETKGISIAAVDPTLFKDMKFKVKVEADVLAGRSESIKRALKLEAYDRAIQNPFADQRALLKDFILENFIPGESEDFLLDPQGQPQVDGAVNTKLTELIGGGEPAQPPTPAGPPGAPAGPAAPGAPAPPGVPPAPAAAPVAAPALA